MFDHIGTKVKKLAKVFFFIGCIIAVIGGGLLMDLIGAALGYLVILVGIALAWISTLLLAAFGQLVENSDIQTELMAQKALEKQNRPVRTAKECNPPEKKEESNPTEKNEAE